MMDNSNSRNHKFSGHQSNKFVKGVNIQDLVAAHRTRSIEAPVTLFEFWVSQIKTVSDFRFQTGRAYMSNFMWNGHIHFFIWNWLGFIFFFLKINICLRYKIFFTLKVLSTAPERVKNMGFFVDE